MAYYYSRFSWPIAAQFSSEIICSIIAKVFLSLATCLGLAAAILIPLSLSSISLINKTKGKEHRSMIIRNNFCGGILGVLFIVFVCLGAPLGELLPIIIGLLLTFLGDILYIILKKSFCKSLDEMEIAACNRHAVPAMDENLNETACIPFLGALKSKNKPTNEDA